MVDRIRLAHIIRALLAKTVARGATPGEERLARAKAQEIVDKYGLSLSDYLDQSAFEAFGSAARNASSDWAAAAAEAAEARRRARAAQQRAAEAQERADAEYARRQEAEAAERRARRAAEALSGLAAQPAMRRLLDLIQEATQEYGGATAAHLADAMNLEEHTIRAMVSRLRKAGVPIGTTRGYTGRTRYVYSGR